MNTKAEIGQALEDFEAGRLGTIPPNALMPHVFDPDPVRAEQTGIEGPAGAPARSWAERPRV